MEENKKINLTEKKRSNKLFDYKKFENDVFEHMKIVLQKWLGEHPDIYIFSLDCAREMESIGVMANTIQYLAEQANPDSDEYWYYKYCEEEWELDDWFKDISANMELYLKENHDVFTASETYEYLDPFDEHCDKVIESCQNALIRFRTFINGKHPDILLTFNIREYLDEETKIGIFRKINDENAVKEYADHIEDFL